MDHINNIGLLISKILPVKMLCIVRLRNHREELYQADLWKPDEQMKDLRDIAAVINSCKEWIPLLENHQYIRGRDLKHAFELNEEGSVLLAIRNGNELDGLFLFEQEGIFQDKDIEVLHTFTEIYGQILNVMNLLEEEKYLCNVYNTMLNGLKSNLYVTDIHNDQILFMNQSMKEEYAISEPEGKICWQVLQNGKMDRCSFCPVRHLESRDKKKGVIQWEETSSFTGKTYRNYDSLIKWIDGSTVHLQQSIDITELKSISRDDLTMLLLRKPGKEALQDTIRKTLELGNTMSVCLYDINLLKETNDKYGHAEGDKLIVTVVRAVQSVLSDKEYAFRLSGDEFIVVFLSARSAAAKKMNHVLDILKSHAEQYVPSFCFGIAELTPEAPLSVEDALMLADEQMYEQKRKFHIRYNEEKRKKQIQECSDDFTYDKDRLYDALVESTEDYIYICNMKTGVFKYTKAMIEEFDLPSQVIENAAAVWGAKVHEDDRAAFLEANQIITDGRSNFHCVEYRALNRDGEWVWVRCRGHLKVDENGEPSIFAGFITNLGKKNKIDNLTGLYNKVEFEEQINHLLTSDSHHKFGVMKLGIDNIKNINDLYDRSFGDEVIRIVSQKIQTMLPEDATIYRLDGDEFGIISRKTGRAGMEDIYNRIYHMFEYQQEYDGKKYYSTLSAGCVLCPDDGEDYNSLIKYAGYAMEFAKEQGKKNCVYFTSQILDYRTHSLEMIEELRESVENDYEGFSLRYQPLVDAAAGKTVGFETLARWHNDKFGDISPVEFIPLLEISGLIIPVGKWILSTALHTCRDWVCANPNLEMNVNISYLQIESPNFVSFLKERIEVEKFPTQNLVLEMTESVLAKESRRTQKIFEEIRKMGIRLAMDDFGTGYSSLGLLKNSPSDIVKIDKTFMRDVLTSSFDATFIKFVVALCHDVGIKVCLEGVETIEEYGAVSPMGLDMIQGYYFGYPITDTEFFEQFIKFNNS